MSIKRIDHVFVDELGMDPLRDTSFDAIMAVERWQPFTVVNKYVNNPQAISDLFYDTVDLWYAILYYNKLPDQWSLIEGLEIRIPDMNAMTSNLSKASTPAVRTQRI